MDYFQFPQMTDEEKSYCLEILSKYKVAPVIEYEIPENKEWWNPDKSQEYMMNLRVVNDKNVKIYQEIVRKELIEDPFTYFHYIIPFMFRLCMKYKVAMTSFQSLMDINCYRQFEGSQRTQSSSHRIMRDLMRQPMGTVEDYNYFPAVIYNSTFFDTIKIRTEYGDIRFQDYISGNYGVAPQKIRDENIAKIEELKKSIMKDINRMLHAVDTKTPYKELSDDISDKNFHGYFADIPPIGKRLRNTYIDSEYNGQKLDLETKDIILILQTLCLFNLRGQTAGHPPPPVSSSRLRKVDINNNNLYYRRFVKYLGMLDIDQMREICNFFDVQTDDSVQKVELMPIITFIFNDVEPPKTSDEFNKIMEQFQAINEKSDNIIDSLFKYSQKSETLDERITPYEKNTKNAIFYERLFKNLVSCFIGCTAVASGRVPHKPGNGIEILGGIFDIIHLGWLVRAIDEHVQTERARKLNIDKPHAVADEITTYVITRYSYQISRIDDDKMEKFADHTLARMIKYIELDKKDAPVSLVHKFVWGLYRVNLKDKFLSSMHLNNEKWTPDGIYNRTTMRNPRGHEFKIRDDDKYGSINIDYDEEKYRVSI